MCIASVVNSAIIDARSYSSNLLTHVLHGVVLSHLILRREHSVQVKRSRWPFAARISSIETDVRRSPSLVGSFRLLAVRRLRVMTAGAMSQDIQRE
jgi:hypothetical protein